MERDICRKKHGGNPQSEAANLMIANKKFPARVEIYEWIRISGPMTCEEVEKCLEFKHQTASARIAELKAEGWLEPTGVVRNGYAELRAVVEQKQMDLLETKGL